MIHYSNCHIWQECNEVPTENCEEKEVKIPKQEKEHKKKCLLADDNSLPASATQAPRAAAEPTPSPTVYTNEPVNNNVIRSNSNITYLLTFGNGQFSSKDSQLIQNNLN